jgi:hypothetical protein
MSTTIRILSGLLATAAVSLAQASASPQAETEPSELPDGIVAKMDRLSSKQINMRDRGARAGNSADGLAHGSSSGRTTPSCGSVDIGNVTTNPFGGGPRQVNVLIKGDVINANNKCGR